MNKFTHFLFYNNTIPILFGILFLGAGATFAASPEARDAVVGSETTLASIDNTYLLNTTISDSTVEISVVSITEDVETYYIEYQKTGIAVQDGAWQSIVVTKGFEVQKDTIVGQDLGLYVAKQLSEVHAFEVRRLQEYQDIEIRAGITSKVVATEYSGIIGQFFDPRHEVFPGYDPLIDPLVGVPLTKEQKAEHKKEQKRIREASENITVVTNAGNEVVIPNIIQDDGGDDESPVSPGDPGDEPSDIESEPVSNDINDETSLPEEETPEPEAPVEITSEPVPVPASE